MGLKRLFQRGPRRPEPDPLAPDGPVREVMEWEDEDLELGPPPVLRPAAIFRQVLYDPAETAPIWARPRQSVAPETTPAPEPKEDPVAVAVAVADVVPAEAPKPAKRKRSPKTTEAAGTSRPASKRAAKPKRGAAQG
jgi:hypothetical protein